MSGRMAILAALLAASAAMGAELASPYVDVVPQPGHADVGAIPDGCAHVLDHAGAPAPTPKGFRIGPDEAMRIAIREHNLGCANEPRTVRRMSANTTRGFYSIASYWSINGKAQLVVVHVDGQSGKIIGDTGK